MQPTAKHTNQGLLLPATFLCFTIWQMMLGKVGLLATLTNLGSRIGYTNDATQKDYIPASINLGTSYTAVFDEQNKIMFGVDLHKLLVPAPPVATTDSATNSNNLIAYRSKSVVSSWFNSFS